MVCAAHRCATHMWKDTPENLLMKSYMARLKLGMVDQQGSKVPNKTLHSTERYCTKFNQ